MNLAFNLDHWQMRDLRKLPELRGKKLVGRGVFSAVFEGSRPDTVLKLTVDSVAYWMLNCCAVGVSGKHFPTVVKNHHDVGEISVRDKRFPVFLYETERLMSLRAKSAAKATAKLIVAGRGAQYHHNKTQDQLKAVAKETKGLSGSVRKAIRDIQAFSESYEHARLDMHMGNFMQRENGDLVITDPLFDHEVIRAITSPTHRRFA